MPSSQTGAAKYPQIISPFRRLATLLDGLEPGQAPIDLSIGEPRHPMPAFVADEIAKRSAEFAKYPPILGVPELRQAIGRWIAQRYPSLSGQIDWQRHILPLCGSREGLFSAIFCANSGSAAKERPVVLIPNPFYFAYAAAAEAAQAEPILLSASAESGFLPDLDAIDATTLERTIALYLASPSNPHGALAGQKYLEKAISLARQHDFFLFADECYSEIYSETPPLGALEAAFGRFGDYKNVIVFQSLSKRSNLPGLRSGFCAGDADFISEFARFRNVACPQMPLPVQHASATVWGDEGHVEASRALYRAKLDAADRLLEGKFSYFRPKAGFFLWLDMSSHGGGEIAAKTLWKACGVKLVPGSYLAHAAPGAANPGENHVRLALVEDQARTETALERIVAWAKRDGQ